MMELQELCGCMDELIGSGATISMKSGIGATTVAGRGIDGSTGEPAGVYPTQILDVFEGNHAALRQVYKKVGAEYEDALMTFDKLIALLDKCGVEVELRAQEALQEWLPRAPEGIVGNDHKL